MALVGLGTEPRLDEAKENINLPPRRLWAGILSVAAWSLVGCGDQTDPPPGAATIKLQLANETSLFSAFRLSAVTSLWAAVGEEPETLGALTLKFVSFPLVEDINYDD